MPFVNLPEASRNRPYKKFNNYKKMGCQRVSCFNWANSRLKPLWIQNRTRGLSQPLFRDIDDATDAKKRIRQPSDDRARVQPS